MNHLLRATATGFLAAVLAGPAWAQSTGDAGEEVAPAAEAPGAATSDNADTGEAQAQPSDSADPASAGSTTPPDEGGQATAADGSDYAMGDIALGDDDAPVTVIEYASFTCPHCGSFAVQTFPQVKEQYIETGKVRFILREVYFDQYGLWASMVARCGGEKGFYPLAETFLATQASWTRSEDIGHAIHQVGRRAGLSSARLEQCLSDRDFAKELLADYQDNMAADGIQSTPTFIINGEKHTGAMSFEEFSEVLDAAL